ncbi:MAG: type VI secretion system amidase effector protein Tae4 [Fibromonadales bacterium]|nr:type VI secretion system amidase effector protein Tae4 [Fibromonadales bacterium]
MATITAEDKKTGVKASIIVRRPSWKNVLAGYPIYRDILKDIDMPSDMVFKSIFGENYNTNIYHNACATRVSIALLKSNVTIDKVEGVILTEVTYGELKGKKVILAADGMEIWLEKKWGISEFKIIKPGSIDKVNAEFSGKKGIYVMRPIDQSLEGFGATGHCTLWIGDGVIGEHYAKKAYYVRLWELK